MKLTPPDEHGMAYLTLTDWADYKETVGGQVEYDLNAEGEVIGIEFLFAPKRWLINGTKIQLIKGENK